MPPPPIGKARKLAPPPRRWPAADLDYDPRLDQGGKSSPSIAVTTRLIKRREC